MDILFGISMDLDKAYNAWNLQRLFFVEIIGILFLTEFFFDIANIKNNFSDLL